jgi:predicted XRE-type DNA-binding protein
VTEPYRTYSWAEIERELVKPEDEPEIERIKAEMEGRVLAYKLAEARKRCKRTQAQVAEAMGVSQARVSKIERGEISKTEVETIRSYINAIGGRLEIIADLGDIRVVLG